MWCVYDGVGGVRWCVPGVGLCRVVKTELSFCRRLKP